MSPIEQAIKQAAEQAAKDARIQELEAELQSWRHGGVTEEILRRQDGFLKVGRGCVLVREDDYFQLKQAHDTLLAEAVRFAEIAYNGHWDTTDATAATVFLNRQDVIEWMGRQKETP